ncbi:MAG: ABC transporter ATP-binding protein [Phycisphaerae bacterium]
MTDIHIQHITKIFGTGASAVKAVDDVSLDIKSGELYFLLGPSGCGKTTLLRIIAGLAEPDRGRVLFGDRDITDVPVERRNTALVFQNYALWPHMTVAQNVEFGPRMRGASRTERRRRAGETLSMVQMEQYAGRKPGQLSGGQQQRVALARALAAEPECLLLDEPLSNLDARLRARMRDELRRLVKRSGTTGVYVTHDQTEALSMADRIALMKDGRVVQIGTPQDLYDRPATRFAADFLGEANFVPGRVVSAGTPARIETPAGVIRASDTGTAAAGAQVTCCVRPERVGLSVGDEQPEGALPATVESTTFLGDLRQVICRLDGDVLWKVSLLAPSRGASQQLQPGRRVALTVDSEDVTVLTE